jgi:hypothetical protein
VKEATMNKIIITLMAIYFVGDPHLQYTVALGATVGRHRLVL